MRLHSVLAIVIGLVPLSVVSAQTGGQSSKSQLPPGMTILKKGSSSRSERKTAESVLPLNRIAPAYARQVSEIVRKPHMFRRLPEISLQVEPSTYQYFTEHPDAAVSIWRVMDISNFTMYQTAANRYEASAGDGSYGTTHVLHRTPTECLLLCNGVYKSPLLVKPIEANCLLHVQTSFHTDQMGRKIASHQASVFANFPSKTVTAAAKVISPVTNGIMDRNFVEISIFLQMMSTAMQRQPDWVEQVAGRMDGVLDDSKRQLVTVTHQVHSDWRQSMLTPQAQRPVPAQQPTARPVSKSRTSLNPFRRRDRR